jgi:hypothetical protein
MGFLAGLFGRRAEPAPVSRPPVSVTPSASRNATRRELVRVALRDTLNRHGVPADWLGVEALSAVTHGREPGLHLRLVVRHWEPQLLACGVALQRGVLQRVLLLDPLAANWMTGISWQFAPTDESNCPDLPPPAHWKSLPADRPSATATASAGPSGAPETAADRKAALDRLLGQGRGPAGRGSENHPEFSDTRPMFSATQPGGV